MRLLVRIKVDYDVCGYHPTEDDAEKDLRQVLESSVDRMVGWGGLSGETPALVDDWSLEIVRVLWSE